MRRFTKYINIVQSKEVGSCASLFQDVIQPILEVQLVSWGAARKTARERRKKLTRARTKRKRFAQSKLDSEINAPSLLNEHGDPHFLFHDFSENNILNN